MAAYKHIKGSPHEMKAEKPEGNYGHQVMHKVGEGLRIKGSGSHHIGKSDHGHDFFQGHELQHKGKHEHIHGGHMDADK